MWELNDIVVLRIMAEWESLHTERGILQRKLQLLRKMGGMLYQSAYELAEHWS